MARFFGISGRKRDGKKPGAPKPKGGSLGSTLVWVLMALLVFGLGGFGVRNFGGGVQTLGSVGDRTIAVNTYARTLQVQLRRLGEEVGQTVTFAQAEALGLDQAVRARVVSDAAIDNEADRLGISIGDARVYESVAAIPQFRGLDGKLDRDAYRQVLRQEGMTEASFERDVRDQAARGIVESAVVGGVAAPQGYIDAVFAYVGEKRGFTRTVLTAADLAEPVPAPTDAEVKSYYDTHIADFTQPEAKKLTYAWLSPDMLADKVDISDEDLRALYDKRRDEFVQPEKRLVERLAFGTEAEATAARARLDSGGATFDALVTERGLKLADVDMGDVTRASLGAAGDAVFGLGAPGIVGPFPSTIGPALYRMNGVIAAQDIPFEAAKAELRPDLALDRARGEIGDRTSDIEDRLAGGATLEDLAKETDMTLGSMDYYAGTEAPLAAYKAFRAAADTVKDGDYPEVIRLDDGGIAALRLDALAPPAPKPLDRVRDAVAAAWVAGETRTRLMAEAEAIANGGAAKATPAAVAPVTRDGFIEGAPQGLVAAVFEMSAGETRVVAGDAEVDVVTLTDVIPAAQDAGTEDGERIRTAIRTQAAQGMASDIYALFTDAAEASAGVTLDEAAIRAVHAQFQ